MEQVIESDVITIIQLMMKDCGLITSHDEKKNISEFRFSRLAGDGSSREFYRISLKGRPLCLAVAPGPTSDNKTLEARSTKIIGCHLYDIGVPVPMQYSYNEEHGIILFEDLGDTKLHDLVTQVVDTKQGFDVDMVRHWYRQVIDNLVFMQVKAAKTFDPDWCWENGCYNSKVMLEKESGYFLRSFYQDVLSCPIPEGINEEFVEIASVCEEEPPVYFLHRDFQSRNIMIKADKVRFIDFQGGRLGPLQYDIASLLIDPYTSLSQKFQEELLDYYFDCVEQMTGIEGTQLVKGYNYLCLQRNLQVVGAFSFLSSKRGKVFFSQYIEPSLAMLNDHLTQSCFDEFPILRKTVASSLNMLKDNNLLKK